MISAFDLEQLQRLLKDFHHITNIRITVFDRELNELVSYPENCPPFCACIRSTAEGRMACAACDREACTTASRQSKTYIYRCHAGLTEAITPLWVGNVLAGYLLFDHVFAYDDPEEGWDIIRRCCQRYPVDMAQLKAALPHCPHVSLAYIQSAAHILHATASYLVMARVATLREDSIAARLDAYLSAHFNQSLTSQQLCRELGISRSRLYKLSGQLYGCGISEHIRSLRIDRAKHLLSGHPEMSIAEIAAECGYTDYNYFIAVFSKLMGISPNAYRKKT